MIIKQIFKDDELLIPFVEECKNRGYKNNSTIQNLKMDYFEHSAFFAGIEDNKIKVFSGIHNFDYNGIRYWRAGFRAITLNDEKFKPVLSSNWRKSSIHFGVVIYKQIKWVNDHFNDPIIVETTNDSTHSIDNAGKSHHVDKLYKSGKIKGFSLLFEKIEYLNTIQNVWLIDQKIWEDDYKIYHKETYG